MTVRAGNGGDVARPTLASAPADPRVWVLPMDTGAGIFPAEFTRQGLARLRFPRSDLTDSDETRGSVPGHVRHWWSLTAGAVRAILLGLPAGELPPLDWSGSTAFQREVWTALLALEAGCTTTYGKLARAIARPGAARAVGTACGSNPVPLLVPCHRVLGANGGLGGFSGGLEWKRRLLAAEGVSAPERAPIQAADTTA
jgi:O-6-methylguanine DNA methyltransferase